MHPGTKNLNTFRTLFLIKGILNLVSILFFAIYAVMGMFFYNAMEFVQNIDPNAPDIPINPGSIFIIVGVTGIVVCGIVGTLLLVATKNWSNRHNRKFLQIVAGINCITGLLGILLCIFTILELGKPEVKAVFDGEEPMEADDIL